MYNQGVSVSLVLYYSSLNEAGAKAYHIFDVPPSKEPEFSLTEQNRADEYRIAIWNPRTEMH